MTLTATIKGNPHYSGDWKIVLAKSGKVTIEQNGHLVTKGSYSSTATTLTFADDENTGTGGCPGPGKYKWARAGGGKVSFTKVSDPCGPRVAVLGHSFTLSG